MTKKEAWEIIDLEMMGEFDGPPEELLQALDTVNEEGDSTDG